MSDRAAVGQDRRSGVPIGLRSRRQGGDEVAVSALPVAPPGVDKSESMLDGSLVVWRGGSGRRLEMGDRPHIVAEERQNLAEGCVQISRRRVPEAEGGGEVVARFCVGEDGPCVLARAAMRLSRLACAARECLVMGDQRPSNAFVARTAGCRTQ